MWSQTRRMSLVQHRLSVLQWDHKASHHKRHFLYMIDPIMWESFYYWIECIYTEENTYKISFWDCLAVMLIICKNKLWSPAILSWRKSQGRVQGRPRTQQWMMWEDNEELPSQWKFFLKPPRSQPDFLHDLATLLGWCKQIWTRYRSKVLCNRQYLLFHQIQPSIVVCKCLHIAWTHFRSCKLYDPVCSICPREACSQFSEKVSLLCKKWSCRLGLLHMVVAQGLVSYVLSAWSDRDGKKTYLYFFLSVLIFCLFFVQLRQIHSFVLFWAIYPC